MSIPRDGPHRGIDCKLEFFSEFEFIFEKALGYESGGWRTCFDEKTRGKISRVSVPLRYVQYGARRKKNSNETSSKEDI
jgi:hypothetical protein